jgi:hypothetical protein
MRSICLLTRLLKDSTPHGTALIRTTTGEPSRQSRFAVTANKRNQIPECSNGLPRLSCLMMILTEFSVVITMQRSNALHVDMSALAPCRDDFSVQFVSRAWTAEHVSIGRLCADTTLSTTRFGI